MSDVLWMQTKTATISEMFACWASPCVFVLMGTHTGAFVCDTALSCSHSSKLPQAPGSICSPLFSICPAPLSLTQSLIQGDYELTSHHHSFACQISLISFYDFITQSKRLNLQAKRPQVDHLGVTMLVQFHVMIAERKLGLISHQMSHNKSLFVGDVFSIWYNPLTSLHILRFSCMVFTENAAHDLHSSSFPQS